MKDGRGNTGALWCDAKATSCHYNRIEGMNWNDKSCANFGLPGHSVSNQAIVYCEISRWPVRDDDRLESMKLNSGTGVYFTLKTYSIITLRRIRISMVNAITSFYLLSRTECPPYILLTLGLSAPPLRSVQPISISLGSV
jgi:hypothetical protein